MIKYLKNYKHVYKLTHDMTSNIENTANIYKANILKIKCTLLTCKNPDVNRRKYSFF